MKSAPPIQNVFRVCSKMQLKPFYCKFLSFFKFELMITLNWNKTFDQYQSVFKKKKKKLSGGTKLIHTPYVNRSLNVQFVSFYSERNFGWTCLEICEGLGSSTTHMNIAACFCFTEVLQKDLDDCVDLWNKHWIRPSRVASCPGGIPNELYLLPHRYCWSGA